MKLFKKNKEEVAEKVVEVVENATEIAEAAPVKKTGVGKVVAIVGAVVAGLAAVGYGVYKVITSRNGRSEDVTTEYDDSEEFFEGSSESTEE